MTRIHDVTGPNFCRASNVLTSVVVASVALYKWRNGNNLLVVTYSSLIPVIQSFDALYFG